MLFVKIEPNLDRIDPPINKAGKQDFQDSCMPFRQMRIREAIAVFASATRGGMDSIYIISYCLDRIYGIYGIFFFAFKLKAKKGNPPSAGNLVHSH